MKKSFFIFWLLLLFTLLNTYADLNNTSYSNVSTPAQFAKTSNTSTNIGNFQNLSAYSYNLATTILLWSKQGGSYGGTTNGTGISFDKSGNIYITGTTNTGLFGQAQNGLQNYFIVKYDPNGYITWSRQVGATGGTTQGYGISSDNYGNIYVTGYTNVGLSGQKQNGNYDYFIAKYDTNGNLIWTTQVGTAGGNTSGYGINADNLGNIYITGYTDEGISGQKQNGIGDYFIAKYDSNGNLIWTKQVGAVSGVTSGFGISADNSSNIYITGYTSVGISGQIQNGTYDYFIARYDTNGNLLWTKQVGAYFGWTYGKGVSADNLGNIYVTGNTDVGIYGQKQNGYRDYFIATYDINGNLIWTTQVGTAGGFTDGSGISTDNLGNVYVTGDTNIGISGQIQNGIWDYFIAKYNKYGLEWTNQVGVAGGTTSGLGISADNLGEVYITGNTNMGISGQKQNGKMDYFIAKYININ